MSVGQDDQRTESAPARDTTSSPSVANSKYPEKFDIDDHACTSSEMEPHQVEKKRGHWPRKLDFIFSCLSFAVGLGNIWRFPYLCYRNGGGAFLIPFLVMLVVCGVPLVFLELAFGQFSNSGVVSSWKVCPLFQGIGWGMFIVSTLIAIYYNVIIAWTLFYLFASLTTTLPWTECGAWSSDNCWTETKCKGLNMTWLNNTCVAPGAPEALPLILPRENEMNMRFPSADYFHNVVLDMSSGIDEMGALRWELALCLLLGWILVSVCLVKGIKTSGKAVYFTALFPYLVLLVLLVRSLTLPGAADGVLYFITPTWSKLATAKVWGDAAVQIFFSLSPCWGGLITLASYNQFHNNCFRDAIIVSVLDCATSIFAGLVIFAIIGFMAHEVDRDVSDVAVEGAGLAFVVYPEVVTHMPLSPLWSILFFAMLACLGLGTQITTVTTIHTTLLDTFPGIFYRNRQAVLLAAVAVFCYLVGLAFCTQGGMFLLQVFDNYAASYSLLIIGFTECVALSWFYGVDRFADDIRLMMGTRPSRLWLVCWRYICPGALLIITIFSWLDFHRTSYNGTVFPVWADGVGWVLTSSSILAIPVVAVYHVVSRKLRLGLPWRLVLAMSLRPKPSWYPRNTLLASVKSDNQQRVNKLPLEAFPDNLCKEDTA